MEMLKHIRYTPIGIEFAANIVLCAWLVLRATPSACWPLL